MSLNHGDLAPSFELPGVDGKSHALDHYADKEALVVVFTCNHCPYAKAYESRLVALQDTFGSQGVQVIAINPNEDKNYPEDSFENMVTRAQTAGFNFPYLRDESQSIAQAYGAERTPHVFVFDKGRKLAYTGAIDDNWKDAAAVEKTPLANALKNLLAGNQPDEPSTFAIGCSIKWREDAT